MKKYILIFSVVVSVFLSAQCNAALVFKITSDQTTLTVGQTTTMHVWGWVNDPLATGTNGLYTWSGNIIVDTAGLVKVNSATVLQPAPLDTYWSKPSGLNSPLTGNLSALGIIDIDATESIAGIGTGDEDVTNPLNYTKLLSFQVEAIGSGTVTYSSTNIVGQLMDYTTFKSINGNAEFYSDGISNVITVVPEPSTLILLSGLWAAGFLTRRKK